MEKFEFTYKTIRLKFKDFDALLRFAHRFNEYFKKVLQENIDDKGHSKYIEKLEEMLNKEGKNE